MTRWQTAGMSTPAVTGVDALQAGTGPEAEFRDVYRRPGVRHLAYAMTFGGATALAFYTIDFAMGNLSWIGGAQSLRLLVIVASVAFAILCLRNGAWAQRHYVALFVVSCVGLSAIGCVASLLRNWDEPRLQLLWSIDMTLIVIMVVIHGFSRLGVLATAVTANVCSVAVLSALWQLSEASALELRRITLHLVIVGVGCSWLRYSIERRERELFELARSNLRRNEHTRQLEAAIRAAKDADATKARFLAHMSHEIRTPMNGVLQILELISDRASNSDRELIDKGQKAGHALLRILNGILDYAKLSHDGVTVRPTVTDLREICRTAAQLHEATAAVKALVLVADLDLPSEHAAHVLVDAVKLLEIINNLVANAIKFTVSGRVELLIKLVDGSVGRPGSNLLLTVTDSGPGMETHELRQAFTPFFRSESAARRAGGTGLGLAIVEQLVTEMKGNVQAESVVGRGTTFRVRLPVENVPLNSVGDSSRTSYPRRAVDAHGEFRGERVLLVDDNELNADLAQQILSMLGLDVDIARSGVAALEQLAVSDYDIVLMDCQMPDMDGYETVRLWRRSEHASRRQRTPIVAVTAFTLLGDKRKCLAAGMDDYLAKPYTAKELTTVLRRRLPARERLATSRHMVDSRQTVARDS